MGPQAIYPSDGDDRPFPSHIKSAHTLALQLPKSAIA
jgi:hypothetical protein